MNWKKKFSVDIFITICIAILPFCLYLYLLVDEESISFFLFGKEYINSHPWYLDVYTILSKVIPFVLFSFWFVISNQKFTYAVLVPIYYNFQKSHLYTYSIFNPQYQPSYFKAFLLFIPLFLVLQFFRYCYHRSAGLNEKVNLLRDNIFITFLHKRKLFKLHKSVFEKTSTYKDEKEDLIRLYHSKQSLDSLSKSMSTSIHFKKLLVLFFITYLLSTPFLYLVYQYVPKDYQFNFFLMPRINGGFNSFEAFIYFSFMKIIPLGCFAIWFITSTNWYRTIILIPITIYAYQLCEILFMDTNKADDIEIIQAAPIILAIILLTLVVSKIYRWDIKSYSIRQQIDMEINRLLDLFARKQ